MTQLDSRLLSEYAFQRTAGAAMRLASRDLAHKEASGIGKLTTDQEDDSANKGGQINASIRTIGAQEKKQPAPQRCASPKEFGVQRRSVASLVLNRSVRPHASTRLSR